MIVYLLDLIVFVLTSQSREYYGILIALNKYRIAE